MASNSSVTNPLATSPGDSSVYNRSKNPPEHGWIFDLGSIRETFVCQARLDGSGQGICLSIPGTHYLSLYHDIWLKTSDSERVRISGLYNLPMLYSIL